MLFIQLSCTRFLLVKTKGKPLLFTPLAQITIALILTFNGFKSLISNIQTAFKKSSLAILPRYFQSIVCQLYSLRKKFINLCMPPHLVAHVDEIRLLWMKFLNKR